MVTKAQMAFLRKLQPPKELKSVAINLRFRPSYKAAAEAMAAADDKSMTAFLEWLIAEEVNRRASAGRQPSIREE